MNLEDARHAHLVGIGGTGMSSLARYLMSRGVTVTGSDRGRTPAVRELEREGVYISTGHGARNLPSRASCVVRSLAVSSDSRELVAAGERDLPILTYPEALGELARRRQTIAVSGTHGKTTTTALIAHVLHALGEDPSWMFGGAPGRGLKPWRAGGGDGFVVEACEYARSFRHIPAQLGVVTSVDLDHLECYGDLAGVRAAFLEFAETILAAGGELVLAAHTELLADLSSSERVTTYAAGAETAVDVGAHAIENTPAGTELVVSERGKEAGRVRLPLFGTHNAENALAAIAVARRRGHEWSRVREAIESFPGVGRRLERLGELDGSLYYDDYAHHPVAVGHVLRSLRAAHPGRRLVAVFEPHQEARTKRHLDDYVEVLALAEVVAVTRIHRAREVAHLGHPRPDLEGDELARRLADAQVDAHYTPSLGDVWSFLGDEARGEDVVVVMGAGAVGAEFAGSFHARRATARREVLAHVH